jgi:hypothetical protein
MDENAPIPHSSADSYLGYSDSSAAASAMKTYNFIFNKYRDEFNAALNYNEKNDRKFQREMRKLAKERERLKNNPEQVQI